MSSTSTMRQLGGSFGTFGKEDWDGFNLISMLVHESDDKKIRMRIRIANILFHTSGRMELSLAQSQRGKLREFSDLGHNPKQFRICLTPSNSKNVVHIYFFSGIHHTAPSACRPGTRLVFLGSI